MCIRDRNKEEFQSNERKIEISLDSNQENLFSINFENKKTDTVTFNITPYITTKQESNTSINQDEDQVLASSISLVSSKADLPYSPEEQNKKPKKKKRKLKRII